MLQKLVKKLGKKKGGFTLIELIIVIAILGILAAILIPTVGGFITTARTNAANADAHTVYTAAVTYVAQNGGTYAAANDYAGKGVAHASGKIADADLLSYLGGGVTFTIVQINFDANGNVNGVKITEAANSTPGTYGTTT